MYALASRLFNSILVTSFLAVIRL